MPRARTTNPRVPRSHESTTTDESNLAPQCCEDSELFSENNIDAAIDRLDDEAEEDDDVVLLSTIHLHSEQVFACSNVAAHQNKPYYTCTSCALLANTYLRNTPNELLEGGTPPLQGKRFFPLCVDCAAVAKKSSAARGCVCDYEYKDLCFKCKLELLEKGAAKRDAEVDSRLGFFSAEKKQSEVLFVTPVLKCICGSDRISTQARLQCTLRCAACEGIVPLISGRAWDPLAKDFESLPEIVA